MHIHHRVARHLVLLAMATVLLSLAGCAAPVVSHPRVVMTAQLKPDGSLTVSETVDYSLPSRVRSISRMLDADSIGDIADVSVTGRMPDGRTVSFTESRQGSPGDSGVLVKQPVDDTHMLLTLYHPFPDTDADGVITLTYRYTLLHMAERYPDAGTFTWDMLGSKGWNSPIEQWSARVAMPIVEQDPLDVSALKAPRAAQFKRTTDGFSFSAEHVQAGGRVQIQVTFSPELLTYVPVLSSPPLAALRAGAQAKYNRSRLVGITWITGCWVAAIALGYWFYRRVDRDPDVLPASMRHEPALGITAPAELSTLMPLAGGLSGRDVAAMLLHLIHRNHLAMVPPPLGQALTQDTLDQVRIARRPAPEDTLLDGEFFLIHWFIDTLGDGRSVTLEQIRRTPRGRFRSDYRVWKRLVQTQIAMRPWFENLSPYREILFGLGCALALATPLIALAAEAPLAWWALPAGTLLAAYALRMRRRTPGAALEVQRWQRLRAQLKANTAHNVRTIAQWERILLYAEAMGIGREAATAMQHTVNSDPAGTSWPDAREATFLAWPLLEFGRQLPQWFHLFCRSIWSAK